MLSTTQGKFRFQSFEVDLQDRTLRRDGRAITINSRTFDLLAYFIRHPQHFITKDDLMDAVWPGSYAEESNLSQHIFLLRKALTGTQSGDKLLIAVPGRGYQFTPAVTELAEAIPEVHAPHAANIEPPIFLPERSASSGVEISEAKEFDEEDDDEPQRRKRNGLKRFLMDFRHPGPWHVLIITIIVVCLGFGGYFKWQRAHRPQPQFLGLVIADLQNNTTNPQFNEALSKALSIDLQQSPFLTVASETKVAQTLDEIDGRAAIRNAGNVEGTDRPLTPDRAREVCNHLNDQVYLTGDVSRFMMKYMVTVRAFDCSNGQGLAVSKGIGDTPDGIVMILDAVAIDLRKQLGGESPASIERYSKPLFGGRGASLEALKAFTDASHLESAGKLTESVTLFQHAVEIDSLFAQAFAELGTVYNNLGQHDLAAAAINRAYELRDSVAEPDRFAIIAAYNDTVTGDLQAGIRNYQSWASEYPNNPVPLVGLARLQVEAGKPALAIDPARRSLQLKAATSLPYVVLAHAQLALGQYEEAAKTCQLAIQRGVDDVQIHSLLMQSAFLRLDQPAMDVQVAWAKGKPAEPALQLELGLIDFAQGKARAAQAIIATALESYRTQGQTLLAERASAALPRIEAELGYIEAARGLLLRLPDTLDSEDVSVAWAEVGDTARAEAAMKRDLEAHPTDTLWQEYRVPQIRAAIALAQGQPAAAVDALVPAVPFDLRSFDTPSMRGRALLAARQPQLAEAEFHKVLEHPGIEPYSHNYALAQLGVARALAQEGKLVESGLAYKLALQIWKDADPDLPRLREAKAEYTKVLTEEASNKAAAAVRAAQLNAATKRSALVPAATR